MFTVKMQTQPTMVKPGQVELITFIQNNKTYETYLRKISPSGKLQ